MRPSGAAVLCDGNRRVSPSTTSTLGKIARAPDGGSQGELRVTSNWTVTAPICLTPNPHTTAAPMAGREQNLKWTTARPPLDPTRVGCLGNSPYYSLVQGIWLGRLELVIMKGRGWRIATAKSRDTAPTEVTWPWPDKVWQCEDMAARARVGGASVSANKVSSRRARVHERSANSLAITRSLDVRAIFAMPWQLQLNRGLHHAKVLT